jgi:uncharacterized protein YPO0396
MDRIGEINQSLAGIPYNTGRHIQLEHQAASDQDVREFGSDLRACSEGPSDRRTSTPNRSTCRWSG